MHALSLTSISVFVQAVYHHKKLFKCTLIFWTKLFYLTAEPFCFEEVIGSYW